MLVRQPHQAPSLHLYERERLFELHRLGILDTEDEHRFDRLTTMVGRILGFPSVMVSLVDENRQWFKSCLNWDVRETGRDVSFCAHAINDESGVLAIPNTMADEMFSANPLVTGPPHIRAYLGVVVRSINRLPIGTLCAIDFQPREISEETIETMKDFAKLVETELLRDTSDSFWLDMSSIPDAITQHHVLPATELSASAGRLCEKVPKDNMVAFVIDVPKLPQVRRAYGSEIGQTMCTELAKRARIGLANRRFIVGEDGERLFAGLVERNEANEEISQIAEALQFSIGNRIQTSTVTVTTPVHIGFSHLEETENSFSEALHRARLAVDALNAPFPGVNSSIYQPGMSEKVERSRSIIAKLRPAMDEDRVKLFFQPKVCFDSNSVSGAEVLIRWTDDELGEIRPFEILEAAETMNQLGSLDAWVFDRACQYLADWKRRGMVLRSLSINISGTTLSRPDFVDWTLDRISRFDLTPDMIDFEILESAVLFDTEDTIEKIAACQKLGFTFSLDDFGTGQSSLSHLARLPVDNLKIDKSFIDDVVHDRTRSAMTHQIIEIGHSLGKSVVAEGVENLGQYLIIRSFGCDIVQGYYCSRPIPEDDFLKLMTEGGGTIKPIGIDKM